MKKDFFFLIFFLFGFQALSINVLIFGDSVDRQTVIEWCELQRNRGFPVKDFVWGSDTLKYSNRKGRMGTLYCGHGNESLSFIHMFGSPDRGMYLNYFANSYQDKFIDSVDRIPHALEVYQNTFGLPDIICLQFASWDSQKIQREHPNITPQSHLWKNFTLDFELDHRKRIDQLITLIDKDKTELILRTAVSSKAGHLLIIEFNRILRNLANSYNLRLFDFDQDIWSAIGYNYYYEMALFRDFIHPKQFYTAVAGDKYLGKRFTSAWMFRSDEDRKHLHRKMIKNLIDTGSQNSSGYVGYAQPITMIGVLKDQSDPKQNQLLTFNNFSQVYLYHESTHQFHLISNHSDNHIILYLRLSFTDVFPVSSEEFSHLKKRIPISYSIQHYPRKYYLVNITSLEKMHIQSNISSIFTMNFIQFRQVRDNDTLAFLQQAYNCPNIPTLEPVLLDFIPPYYLLDTPWALCSLKGFHKGAAFQYLKERTVYLVSENYHKKVIQSMSELLKYISDISEIVKLYYDYDLEVLPPE